MITSSTYKRTEIHNIGSGHPIELFIHNPIPIDRETGVLSLDGCVAKVGAKLNFGIVGGSHQDAHDKQRLSVLDSKGVHAGTLTVDEVSSNSTLPNTFLPCTNISNYIERRSRASCPGC
jgi:hypothetical protein